MTSEILLAAKISSNTPVDISIFQPSHPFFLVLQNHQGKCGMNLKDQVTECDSQMWRDPVITAEICTTQN